MTCEKKELSLPGQPQRGQNPGWVAAAGLPDSQFISMSASAPSAAVPAAWLDNTAPFCTASEGDESGCVCTGDGSCLPSASFFLWAGCWFPFSALSVCTNAACAQHSQACLPLGSRLSCHTALAGLVFAMAEHGAFFSCTDHGCPQQCVLRDIFQLRTEKGTPDTSILLLSKSI